MQAGSAVMNLLPPQTRDCVNKVTTKAVSDSLVSKLASSAGSLLGNAAPQITRDPGTLECKNNVPYYKETAHLKANVFNLPIDLPVTTESDLTSCLPGILNFCTGAASLLGANGGNVVNGLTGANKPNPQLTVGGTAIGGNTNTNSNGQTGTNPLSSLLQGGNSNNGANTSNNGASGSNGNNGNAFGKLLGGGSSNNGGKAPNGNGNSNPLGSLLQGGNNGGNAPNGNGNGNSGLFEGRGHN